MADWRRIPEAGTVLGIRIVVGVARLFTRRIAGWFLWLVCLYYVVFRGVARRASRAYLRRVGQPDGLGSVLRHIHMFAQVSLDRLFFLTGRWRSFEIVHHGHDVLRAAAASGRGALLLGAHLGSFEVMRSRAEERGVPITAVVDFRNAARMNGVLRALAPNIDLRVIALGVDPMATMLAVKGALERGELVAILGDRVSAADKKVVVDFLGDKAAFPAGPWILAHTLHCPVYFFTGIYTPPRRYDLYCELLAAEVKLERSARAAAMERHAAVYAEVLERHVRLSPWNWFNFYDFWSTP